MGTRPVHKRTFAPREDKGNSQTFSVALLLKYNAWQTGHRAVSSLSKRGLLGEERATDKQYEKQVKGMRTLEIPELSEEEIEAARKRRAASRVTDPEQIKQELEQMEVPANHPWASKEMISEEEERRKHQQLLQMNEPPPSSPRE